MTTPYLAALFDMDGLLFDTEAIGRWAWTASLSRFGQTMTDDLYHRFIGRDMPNRLRILRERFGADFPAEEAAKVRLAIGDEREVNEGVPLKPGAAELLRALHARGLPLALATGTARNRAARRLRQAELLDCFTAIVTSADVPAGKPAPDIFLAAAHALGRKAGECVVFEDSAAGVESALAAGAHVVLVPDLEPLPEPLRARCEELGSLEEAMGRVDAWFGGR